MTYTWSVYGVILCTFLLSSVLKADISIGRELRQTKKELAEIEREDNALEAYHLQQASLNKELENMLTFGRDQAVKIVNKFNKGSRKVQVKLFAELWSNAEGVTIVKSLASLIEETPKKENDFFSIISESMDSAEDTGYGLKVSEALYHGLAVADSSQDHYHLLNALLYRMEEKNKKKKGSGCEYIEFLFSDAEIWAIDDGRTQQFFRGFDSSDYLPIVECFLPECEGTALKCCTNTKAVSSGLCQCTVINKKENMKQCDHNLFGTAPRTIWLCGLPSCEPDEKCLCPKPGSIKKSNNKKKDNEDKTNESGSKPNKKKSDKKDKEDKTSESDAKPNKKKSDKKEKKTKKESEKIDKSSKKGSENVDKSSKKEVKKGSENLDKSSKKYTSSSVSRKEKEKSNNQISKSKSKEAKKSRTK